MLKEGLKRKQVYYVQDIADAFGVRRETIHAWLKSGKLAGRDLGSIVQRACDLMEQGKRPKSRSERSKKGPPGNPHAELPEPHGLDLN